MTKETLLYTEMVVSSTIHYSDRLDWHLKVDPDQRPVALQVPELMANAARMAERYGYDEVNMNVGCPANRVACKGCFGSRLMLDPEVVRACTAAMIEACNIPVTVKRSLRRTNGTVSACVTRTGSTVPSTALTRTGLACR